MSGGGTGAEEEQESGAEEEQEQEQRVRRETQSRWFLRVSSESRVVPPGLVVFRSALRVLESVRRMDARCLLSETQQQTAHTHTLTHTLYPSSSLSPPSLSLSELWCRSAAQSQKVLPPPPPPV